MIIPQEISKAIVSWCQGKGGLRRRQSIIERDGNVIDRVEVMKRKYDLRYEPAWQIYVREEDPESKADFIVDNRDFSAPRLSRIR